MTGVLLGPGFLLQFLFGSYIKAHVSSSFFCDVVGHDEHRVDHGLANYGLWAKSEPLSVTVEQPEDFALPLEGALQVWIRNSTSMCIADIPPLEGSAEAGAWSTRLDAGDAGGIWLLAWERSF